MQTKNVVLAGFAILVALCNASGQVNSNSPVRVRPGEVGGPSHPSRRDESQAMTQMILRDLAEQIFYAKHRALPDASAFSVRVTDRILGGFAAPIYDLELAFTPGEAAFTNELKIKGPIWSPETYAEVITGLAGRIGVAGRNANGDAGLDLLEALTDGKAQTIETWNRRLSERLEKDFSNPALHEQAAVLLGAFALREHAGDFSDTRHALCRMTAHLGLARYFAGRTGTGVSARVAAAMLATGMGNQSVALQELEGIHSTNRAVVAWIRALRARNTTDYRELERRIRFCRSKPSSGIAPGRSASIRISPGND